MRIRIATVLEDDDSLRKAWDLTQYGRRLDHQFQYPGDEPFVDFYPAYTAFFAILLGENIDAGLKVFERKARSEICRFSLFSGTKCHLVPFAQLDQPVLHWHVHCRATCVTYTGCY